MRYLSIAVAALGLLTVGEAKCKPRPSSTLASNTPATGTPTSAAGPDATDYIDNGNFALGLKYYDTTGNVTWVGDDGYDGDGGSKDGTSQLTTKNNDDDNTEASPVQKRDNAETSISTTVKHLVASSPYTISFHYLVLAAMPDNSCRLRAYFNGNNFANTDRFPLTLSRSTAWSQLTGTVIPSSATGTLKISLNCNAVGLAVVYVDSITVTKGVAAVSSTATQISSSSSSAVASGTPVSSTGGVVSSTTPVSTGSGSTNSQVSSATPASSGSAVSTTPAASSSSVGSDSNTPSVSNTTPGASSSGVSSVTTPASSNATPSGTSDSSSSTPASSGTNSSGLSSGTPSSTPASSSAPDSASSSTPSSTINSTPSSAASSSTPSSIVSSASSSAISSTPSSTANSTPSSAASSNTPSSSAVSSTPSSAAASSTPSSAPSTTVSSTPSSTAVSSTPASASTPSSTVSSAASSTPSSSAASSTPSSSAASSTPSSSAASSTPSSSAASSTPSSSAASSTTPVPTTSSTPVPSSTATPTPTSSSALPSATVDSTVLILAKDAATAKLASDGLNAYGIPFQSLLIAQAGTDLPVLNSSLTSGNYGGIIVMSSVSYNYGGTTGWQSAITTAQWTALNNYQSDFNVRMVRIDEYPGAAFGATPGTDGGCCTAPVTQNIYFSDTSDFPTAQLKANAQLQTDGLYHVPAVITDVSTTKAVAMFAPASGSTVGGVAGVINNFNGREQFVWFISWATDWSPTSNWLQHAHIHWMTRGVFVGKRKIHLNDQVDDLQLSTQMFYPQNISEVKIGIPDLQAHIDWQTSINSRMPAGSDFWLELGHNGNGNIINATLTDDDMNTNKCNPVDAVYWDQDVQAPDEWRKTLGTGTDVWPTGTKYETYSWSSACSHIDQFGLWFTVASNLNKFAHLSHTFSHMNMNNATYHDAKREIQFNQAWLKQMGIDKATRWTGNGIIPPAITGLNNGDSIQALMENGIKHVVGDNTRPATRNPNSVYYPLISTYATNGYDGLIIIPRFASRIYFNCHTPECTLREWIQTSAGSGDFNNLLSIEKSSSTRNLFALQSDPYMFHQANMYTTGNDMMTIGDQTRRMSLLMAWTETIVQEMIRLTNWPITSQTQDQMATYFVNRMTLDACNPKLSYVWSNSGTTLQKVIVTANGNTCSTPIPVTIPQGSSTASGGSVTSDVVGAEPPIQWVTLNGSPVTLTLSTAVTRSSSTIKTT